MQDQEKKRARYDRWNAKRKEKYHTEEAFRRRELDRTIARYHSDPAHREEARVLAVERRRKLGRKYLLFRDKGKMARAKGLAFTIKLAEMHWPTHCPVLGIPLDYGHDRPRKGCYDNYPTIDRWDLSKGYVPGNAFVVSHRANYLKSNATPDELAAVAKYARFGPELTLSTDVKS